MKSSSTPVETRPLSEIPGPSQLPWIGNAHSFASNKRLEWISGLSAKYGRLVRLNLVGDQIVVVHDPDWIKYILQKNYKDFSKEGRAIEAGREILGNGLFTNEGEFWRKQRKLAQPAFYKEKLAALGETMVDCISEMTAQWDAYAREEKVVDVAEEMMRLTLNVVTRTMFSSSLTQAEFEVILETFPAILRETTRRILTPFPFLKKVPTRISMDYEKNIQRLDDILYRMIAERKKSGQDGDDLLGMLMAARDEESGEGMSEKQLRDEVMTIFIAGHETTAQALTWAFYLLDRNPKEREQVEQEAKRVLGDRKPNAMDFMALSHTLKVFKETLRLYPPVVIFPRNTLKPFVMEGYEIPAGTKLFIPPYMMHRDPEYWENPTEFKPDHFTPEAEKDRPKFVFFPFGGGPRICIGNNFALMEAVFAIAMVAQRFRVLPLDEEVEMDFSLTLRPKGGMNARISHHE